MASPPSPSAKANAKILTLPPELIEQTLILAASHGFPSAIAQLSCTCRYFHRLVYRSTDNHLWREVFLATFDDPRQMLGRINSATLGSVRKEGNGNSIRTTEVGFDWEREFICRMDAARIMAEYGKAEEEDSIATKSDHVKTRSNLSRALKSLLSVLDTAYPFPAQSAHDDAGPAPTFPPALTADITSLMSDDFISSSASWVTRVIKNDFPSVLVKRFLATQAQRRKTRRETEKIEDDALTWENSEESQLFHKLVFLNGFSPFSDILDRSTPLLEHTSGSPSPQLCAARDLARSKVYNLRYLLPQRSWGPFLQSGSNMNPKEAGHNGESDLEEQLSGGVFGLADVLGGSGQPVNIADIGEEGQTSQLMAFEDEFEDDGDYVPNDNESDDEEYDDDIRLILTNSQQRDPAFVPLKPHQVVPDYAFLSAARLLVEMNLREVLVLDIPPQEIPLSRNLEMNQMVDAFAWLQFVRMGGAPGFWDNWPVSPDKVASKDVGLSSEERMFEADFISGRNGRESMDTDKGKGKGKVKYTGEYEGWDWAGAAGEWKRAVCWLDYRDLLLHNLTGFPSESLEETVRVFPMTLRVKGYSPPPDPEPKSPLDTSPTAPLRSIQESLLYTLPVIHLEGESRGSDLDSTVLRHVTGTVRMIADGAVRWTLTSSFPGDSTPEWVTESVQVGAIGSVVGIIGMWTGAEHAPTDPLGPAWSWKVA